MNDPESKTQPEDLADHEKHPTQRDLLLRIAAAATPIKVSLDRRRFLVGSAMAGLGGAATAAIPDGELGGPHRPFEPRFLYRAAIAAIDNCDRTH
jgi:hypothetical protein